MRCLRSKEMRCLRGQKVRSLQGEEVRCLRSQKISKVWVARRDQVPCAFPSNDCLWLS